MARISSVPGVGLKLEAGDKIQVMGVKGEVTQVQVLAPLPAFGHVKTTAVIVSAILLNAEMPSVFNLSEIEAVSFKGKWMTLKGLPVS
jgi:hypothetical protein